MAEPSRENRSTAVTTDLLSPAVHVPDRVANSHRETSSPRPTAYETHTVASQSELEDTRITTKDDSNTQVSAPSFTMEAGGKTCAPRSTIAPITTRSANFHRCIQGGMGRSLKQVYCKRVLVSARKQDAHKLSGTKSSLSSLKRVPRPLCGQDSSSGHRQYDSSVLHKQGRRHEVGPVCPIVENLDLVYPATSNSESPSHPRPTKCGSRQVIPAGPDHPDRMVPPSRGFSGAMPQMAPTSDRPLCHEVQPQVASVCVPSTGLPGCSSECTHSAMGGSGCIRLPTDCHIGQSGGEVKGFPVQENHSDCSGMAQHALVLGPGDHVQSSTYQPAHPAQSVDSTLQSDPSEKSDKSESPCMAPRATAIKEQGFSQAVAARIEAQSMRQSGPFLQSGASLIRWTSGHPL